MKSASKDISEISGFAPLGSTDAKVLILGSMPGVPSLVQNQYYANPRNAFWSIMSELFDFSNTLEYSARVEHLKRSRVAIWDVIARCTRPGSLDSNIDSTSVVTNNFVDFFRQHKKINLVLCNGARAHSDFSKLVVPTLPSIEFECHKLLSTSPANARYTFAEKLENWRIIKDYL